MYNGEMMEQAFEYIKRLSSTSDSDKDEIFFH